MLSLGMNVLREKARVSVVFFFSTSAQSLDRTEVCRLSLCSEWLDNDLVTVCTVTSEKVP